MRVTVIDLDRAASVDGHPARTVDASPSGLGAHRRARNDWRPATRSAVSIQFDDAGAFALRGKVTDRRVSAGTTSVGIALDLDAGEHDQWVRRLFSAAGLTGRLPTLSETRGPRRRLSFENRPGGGAGALWRVSYPRPR